MDYKRRVRVPVGRVAVLVLLPLLGGLVVLGWTRGLYANAVLATLIAIWVVVRSALAMRRDDEPLAARSTYVGVDEAAVREQRRLTAYLNLSPVPLVTLEDGYRLRAVNRTARRLLGAEDVVPDPDPDLARAITATSPGRSATVRLIVGAEVQSYALVTADLTGAGPGARIAALVDIEAELRAAEAGALRDLLQVLSHEIMNALTPIASLSRTAADILDGETDQDRAAARDAVHTVARRAEGLHRFSRSYRELARLPEPNMRSFKIAPFFDDLTRLFRTRWPEIAFNLEIDDNNRSILVGDADQLSAASWALLQNAAEAVTGRDNGCVVVTVRMSPESVLISVSDNGCGVSKDDRARVFQPFFSTKPGGSGVGLALARQVVLAHRGKVEIVSDTETGTKLTMRLPVLNIP